MDNCIFCKIASHQIPGKILYEDDVCMAFLDLSQTTNGHTLVIPKKHYQHVLDVDRKSTRLNSSHRSLSRMPSSA